MKRRRDRAIFSIDTHKHAEEANKEQVRIIKTDQKLNNRNSRGNHTREIAFKVIQKLSL